MKVKREISVCRMLHNVFSGKTGKIIKKEESTICFKKKRLPLQIWALLSLLFIFTLLSGEFGEAVRITDLYQGNNTKRAYFGGDSSFRVKDSTIHIVSRSFESPDSTSIIYHTYSPDNHQRFELDSYSFYGDFGIGDPVMEITPLGDVIMLYQEPIYGLYKLHELVVNRYGEVLSRDYVRSYVNHRNLQISYNDRYNILIKKGKPIHYFSTYHLLTDIDRGLDDVPGGVRYYAGDVIYGSVHSNTDIWLTWMSWPRFYGLVTTAGEIRVYPGGGTNYPREQIFLGGLITNYYEICLGGTNEVRRNAFYPFGRNERDDAIAYVTVDGSVYSGMIGEIVTEDIDDPEFEWVEGVNQYTMYTNYPPYGLVGDTLGINRIPRIDTVWTAIPGGVIPDNSSIFIPMELWISGNFSGKQTWASSHNIYLKDDLTYTNTVPGQRPDGYDENGNQTLPVNETDYLGIISEKSIFIQYGHKSPIDSVRYRPNTQDIYMYGAYCALGSSDNPWEAGVFTFQYQHPKGSTPPQYWIGERFKDIDLHRFHYPTTAMNEWPPGLDYPWYNPLWPEPGEIYGFPGFPVTPNPHGANSIVKLRGDAFLFGSVTQRRASYMRRSGNDDYDTGMWDVDNFLNPNTPPQYGAAVGPTGYNKRYVYDHRFDHTIPPDMSEMGMFNFHNSSYQYLTSYDGVEYDTLSTGIIEDYYEPLLMTTFGNTTAIVKGTEILVFRGDNNDYDVYDIQLTDDEIIRKVVLNNEGLYLLTTNFLVGENLHDSKVYLYSFFDNSTTLIREKQLPTLMQTLYDFNGNILWAAFIRNNAIAIYVCNINQNDEEVYHWVHNIPVPNYSSFYWQNSSTISLQSEGDMLYIAVYFRVNPFVYPFLENHLLDWGGDVYVAWGRFEYNPTVASHPAPEDEAAGIPVELEQLSWFYLVDTSFVNPVGFRVYLNDTGEFAVNDDFIWVDYVDEQYEYSTSDILPALLDYDTDYYWKVVPTTIKPEDVRAGGRERRAKNVRTIHKSPLQTRGDALNNPIWTFRTEIDSSVEQDLPLLVTELQSNYPNPFNPNTTINYSIGEETNVELTVYNIRGQIIKKLVNEILKEGRYQVSWDGDDLDGKEVSTGLYFYRLKTANYDKTGKMMLVK